MLAPALVGTPGAKFSYSNVGYALLAAVVEVVTGKPFEDYVRKELFGPAGLTETGFIDDAALKKLGRATVRRCDDCEPTWTAVDWWWGWGYRGMGGVVTSARDFVKWDRALRGDKVLGAAAKAKYFTPALEDYACGWKTGRTPRGKPTATHSGGVRGYAIEVTWGSRTTSSSPSSRTARATSSASSGRLRGRRAVAPPGAQERRRGTPERRCRTPLTGCHHAWRRLPPCRASPSSRGPPVDADAGTTILDASLSAGIPVTHACGGRRSAPRAACSSSRAATPSARARTPSATWPTGAASATTCASRARPR
jgi:CubicO group peptidase (beta-lactamase class C family)